jgi:hypothetical protein
MPSPEARGSDAPAGSSDERLRRWCLVLWPSFLAACLLEGLVFAMVDPAELHWPGYVAAPSNQAIYTAAFFAFWLITLACCRVVLWLAATNPDGSGGVSGKPGN